MPFNIFNQLVISLKSILSLLLLIPVLVFADDYQSGVDAYNDGDFGEAFKIWSSTELAKDPRVLFAIGRLYSEGSGVEKNIAKAVEYYLEAANLDFPSAQFNLGLSYWGGRGVEKNSDEALNWWKKASDLGHGGAQYNIAAVLWNGTRGLGKDQATAMNYFRKALANGNEKASDFLYSLFEPMYDELQTNHELYRNENAVRTIPLIEELGMYKLAQQAMEEESYGQAYKYWTTLAEDGHDQSQFMLGKLYEKGNGVDKNIEKALEWYDKAAKSGSANAQFRLGRFHMNEAEVINKSLGLYWIQTAADNDFAPAKAYLLENN